MARGPAPPESVVSAYTGLVGLAALIAVLIYVTGSDLPATYKTLLCLAVPAGAMTIWELFINNTHLRPTTGLNFSEPAPLAENIRRTAIKLFGLWGTWALIGLAYWVMPTYEEAGYQPYLSFLWVMLPVLCWLSVIYVLVVDRYSVDPKDDGCWHAGLTFAGRWKTVDREILKDHFLGWTIKAFFLPFMVSVLPNTIGFVTNYDYANMAIAPFPLADLSMNVLFLIDVSFGAIGYIFALRFLDTHIRTANPLLGGWIAALICYPPFNAATLGGPIRYMDGRDWTYWLGGHDWILWFWGGLIVFLVFVFAWSTVIFGLRFSNLTHRGIITNGPYRYSKHPAYLSKNLFWWAVHMPFLSMAGWDDAVRNSIMLVAVNLIYYWRAKTEEKHLLTDPAYRNYAQWIAENGLFAKIRSVLAGG